MDECVICHTDFCVECSDMTECEGEDCERTFCNSCAIGQTCHHCNQRKCRSCVDIYQCDLNGCNKVICEDCIESTGEGGRCDACSKDFCSTECRYLADEDGIETCVTCLKASASEFHRKLQESKKEIEELCHGMDDLYKKYMNVEEEK